MSFLRTIVFFIAIFIAIKILRTLYYTFRAPLDKILNIIGILIEAILIVPWVLFMVIITSPITILAYLWDFFFKEVPQNDTPKIEKNDTKCSNPSSDPIIPKQPKSSKKIKESTLIKKKPIKNNKKQTELDEILSELDETQRRVYKEIELNDSNIFIQGQAGTGKSTFLRFLKEHTKKDIRFLSPTAIAAANIAGTTLHSFFGLPISDYLSINQVMKDSHKTLFKVLNRTDTIVIDEISMVRPDIFDVIDELCKNARNSDAPFGGIQVILIGDLYQLPPVIRNSVKTTFQKKYGHTLPYFFDSDAYKNGEFKKFEFKKVYRQTDSELLKQLNNIRNNTNSSEVLTFFNNCKIKNPLFLSQATKIASRKDIVERINNSNLDKLKSEAYSFDAIISGGYKDKPAPEHLVLKEGAIVLFNKNHAPLWINGSMGIVKSISPNVITVKMFHSGKEVNVRREKWNTFDYTFDNNKNKVVRNESGAYTQFPLQLGYALTIHKSQGKTLDKVIIDVGSGAFAHGQLYVALSRTRSSSDMHIVHPIKKSDIIIDQRILKFLKSN